MNTLTSSHVSNFDGAVHEINFSDTNSNTPVLTTISNRYVNNHFH